MLVRSQNLFWNYFFASTAKQLALPQENWFQGSTKTLIVWNNESNMSGDGVGYRDVMDVVMDREKPHEHSF